MVDGREAVATMSSVFDKPIPPLKLQYYSPSLIKLYSTTCGGSEGVLTINNNDNLQTVGTTRGPTSSTPEQLSGPPVLLPNRLLRILQARCAVLRVAPTHG